MKQDLLQLKEQLLKQARGETDQVFYTGVWHESIPGYLYQDPLLNSVDRNIYGIIKIQSKKNEAKPFPNYEELMKMGNIGSKQTVARSLQILRLLRWVVQLEAIRDHTGRFRQNVYIINDEPLSIEDVLVLDEDYFEFLQSKTSLNQGRVRNVAVAVHEQISSGIAAGETYQQEDQKHTLLVRQETHEFVQGSLANTDLKQVEISNEHDKPGVSFFGRSAQDIAPSTLSVHGENNKPQIPSTLGVHGDILKNNQNIDAKLLIRMSTPPSTPGVLCSSSFLYNKATTNTNFETLNLKTPKIIKKLSKNEQLLMAKQLSFVEPDFQQLVLNEIAGKLTINNPPVRNPVAYLATICKSVKNGDMTMLSSNVNFLEDEAKQQQQSLDLENKSERNDLINEISGYENQYKRYKKIYESDQSKHAEDLMLMAEKNLKAYREKYAEKFGKKH